MAEISEERAQPLAPGQLSFCFPQCISTEQVDQPCLQARNTIVIEPNNSVVLISTNDTGVSIQCSFNGQSLKLIERMKLSQDKGTLAICPVRKEDAGNYKCEVSKVVTSSKTDPLSVRRR